MALLTSQQRIEMARDAARKRWKQVPPEARSAAARKAVQARWKKHKAKAAKKRDAKL